MGNILYIHWKIDPILFSIGEIRIAYYSLLFVGGLILCTWLFRQISLKEGASEEAINSLIMYTFLGITIGARLGHCIFYDPGYYFNHPFEIILPFKMINQEIVFIGYRGLASHGGVIGLILAVMLHARKYKQSMIQTFDYIAIVAPLGACFIRLGNLMNSEIIGEPTDLPWAFVFERVDFVPRHPAQLYEAVAYFIFFLIMLALHKKNQVPKPGFLFGLVLILIFTFRFFIEFLKEKQSDFEFNLYLDMGQILSIPFVLLGLYYAFVYKRKVHSKVVGR